MGRYDGHDVATLLAYGITLLISYGSQTGLFGKTNADVRIRLTALHGSRCPGTRLRHCAFIDS